MVGQSPAVNFFLPTKSLEGLSTSFFLSLLPSFCLCLNKHVSSTCHRPGAGYAMMTKMTTSRGGNRK